MSSIPKRVFTSEYRAEAVKLVAEGKLGVSAAAGKLGVSVKTYSNWVRQAKAGTLADQQKSAMLATQILAVIRPTFDPNSPVIARLMLLQQQR
jgi:transposase